MMLPFDSLVAENRELGLVVAVLIGFGFGFVLERAGFGRATKLAGQFYLTDMTVFKVMFSAIVTAMLGLIALAGVGVVDLAALSARAASETYIWPMAIGGFLLGVGFIVSGYCPGTSMVATASGNRDGLVTFLGVIVGSVIYGELQPLFADFHVSSNVGQVFLYDLLNVPPAVVAIGVVVMAIGGFIGAEALERVFRRKRGLPLDERPQIRRPRRLVFASFAAVLAAGLGTLALPVSAPSADARSATTIGVEELAHDVLRAPWELRVLDLRDLAACSKERIPGAECAPAETLGDLGLQYAPGERPLVLVAEGDLPEAPAAALAFPGEVRILNGGFAAWRAFALEKPEPLAADADDAARERYVFRSALNQALTGAAPPPPPPTTGKKYVPKKKKKGGGCS